MSQFTILYLGLDPETPSLLLADTSIKVIGVSSIEALTSLRTLNPCNLFFVLLYRQLHYGSNANFTKAILGRICTALQFFTTGTIKRYANYILLLSKYRIPVFLCDDYHNLKNSLGITPDLILTNVWEMLPAHLLSFPNKGIINIHPSKLPKYRGALPTLWTLKNRDTESAVSYIILSPQADSGGILAQYPFPVLAADDALTLEHKIASIIRNTLTRVISDYVADKLQSITQNQTEISYTDKYEPYRLVVPEQEFGKDIYNKVQLYPHLDPGTYCYLQILNRKVELKHVCITSKTSVKPGLYLRGLHLEIHTLDTKLIARLFLDIAISDSLFLIRNRQSFAHKPQ